MIYKITTIIFLLTAFTFSQQGSNDFIVDDTLLLLRQKEIELQTTIERLSVDLAVAEKNWQEARSKTSSLLMTNDTVSQSNSQTLAYWQHLKTLRIEIENAKLYLEYIEQHVYLRKSLLRKNKYETGYKNYWKTVADSVLLFNEKIMSQSQWFDERLAESKLERKAITLHLNEEFDSTENKNIRWIEYRKRYLEKLIDSDSAMSFTVKNELNPLFLHYRSIVLDSLNSVPKGQRLKDILSRVKSIWQFEFSNVDGKSITFGKIIIAILIIVVGTRLAQIISKFGARIISKQTSIDMGVIDASRKLFFYCFTIVFAIYALYIVQVPLTAFTLLGGALALGLGFGSQTIISNFISGIILLVERPVKTGDFIAVESSIGTVETIGLRSVRIRTVGNEHLIIPNSSLLDKPLVNWTLSDKIIRLELAVGVVYGSPIREVKRMLLAAATSIDRINSKPEPLVVFSDFGDNSLLFHLIFWSKIGTIIDKRMILSQLRFKVVDLFTQAGIVIAFPQRDVHLDSEKPLRIAFERSNESELKK